MGMIKKIIRRTSRKLLATIIPNCQSHELVLSQPAQPGDLAAVMHKSSKMRVSKLQEKLRKSSVKDTAVAQALLLAAKNYLPPVQFHHVHGPNAQLNSNRSVARRTQGFCQALVFSNRVILPNERVYIRILEIAKGWSGTIRFGFTAVDPATLAYRMPKHACPDMTNAGHTWARALADEVVRRNSVIHFSYNKDGFIHYGINNQDCGIFHANVSTNQNLWFIVDVYGLTAAVELIDPRVNSATCELNDDRATMYKSTSAMDDIFGGRPASSRASRVRRKQSRKAARHAAAAGIIHSNWPLERSVMLDSSGLPFAGHNQQGGNLLPNLNSISLPSAEQNIYTPMPAPMEQRSRSQQRPNYPVDAHDYHQIVTSDYSTTAGLYGAGPVRPQAKLNSSGSVANTSSCSSSSQYHNSSVIANNTLPASTSVVDLAAHMNHDLVQQFQGLNLNDSNLVTSGQQKAHQSRSPNKISSSSSQMLPSLSQQTPVAAVRRARDAVSERANSKRALEAREQTRALNHRVGSSTIKANALSAASSSAVLSPSSSSSIGQTAVTNSSSANQTIVAKANVKPRTRHSIKQQKASTATSASTTIATNTRDNNNNNSSQNKDCPICFERPINCVLYQCGHMCTCYECGVKQWKTQSRTCPICRTIIKDVIKTYMS